MNSLQETHRIMSKKELKKSEVITRVIAGAVTIYSAAQLMNLSYRQARRLVKKVRNHGQEVLFHGLRGRVIQMKDITGTYTAAEQRRAAKKKSKGMIAQLKELYRPTKGKKSFMDKEIIGRFNEIVSA